MIRRLAVLLLLTGCAVLEPSSQATPPPATLWTEANARYSNEQHEAAQFALRCDRDPALFLSGCHTIVRDLNRIDQEAETVQEKGYGALGRQDMATLHQAIADLDELGEQMETLLEKESSR